MSLEEQERNRNADALDRGLDVVGSFADDGFSGFKGHVSAKRPGFNRLLATISNGGVGYVSMVDNDRADRNMEQLVRLVTTCQKSSTLIIFGDEVKDPNEPADAVTIYEGGVDAMKESVVKSKRVRRAKSVALAAGFYNGGRRPFGFTKPPAAAPGFWEQEPNEARALRSAVQAVLSGTTLAEIAEQWNDGGVTKSSSDTPWNASQVRSTLLSPVVAGLRASDGKIAGPLVRPDGTPWPAIITPETREQLVRAMASRRVGGGPAGSGYRLRAPALLSGLIVCGECGMPLTVRRWASSARTQRPTAYSCQSDGGARCGRVSVTAEHVDALVTDAVLVMLERKSTQLRREFKSQTRAGNGDAHEMAIEELREELSIIDAAREAGDLPAAVWIRDRKPLQERLDAALAARENDDSADVLRALVEPGVDLVAEFERRDLTGQRRILAACIESVAVLPVDKRGPSFDPKRVPARGFVWRF